MLCLSLSSNAPTDLPTRFPSPTTTIITTKSSRTPTDFPTYIPSVFPTDFPTQYNSIITTINRKNDSNMPSDIPTLAPSNEPIDVFTNAVIGNNIIIAIIIGILFGCLFFVVFLYFGCKSIDWSNWCTDKNSDENNNKKKMNDYDADIELLTNPDIHD